MLKIVFLDDLLSLVRGYDKSSRYTHPVPIITRPGKVRLHGPGGAFVDGRRDLHDERHRLFEAVVALASSRYNMCHTAIELAACIERRLSDL